jgi:hypothetical protein
MGKNGEIERIAKAHNKIRWNDELTNRVRWTNYTSEYEGLPMRPYEPAEQELVDKLKARYKNNLMPRNFEDMQHTMQLQKDQDMDALKEKINTANEMLNEQSEKLNAQNEMLKAQSDTLAELKAIMLAMLNKEPLAEEKAKRHLSLVPMNDD